MVQNGLSVTLISSWVLRKQPVAVPCLATDVQSVSHMSTKLTSELPTGHQLLMILMCRARAQQLQRFPEVSG